MGSSSRHSLMQVSEFTHNPYWGTLRQSRASCGKPRISDPVRGNPSRENDICIDEKAAYACDPQHLVSESRTELRSRDRVHGHNRKREREKRYGLADPAVWDAINRSLTQQRRLSGLMDSGDLDAKTNKSPDIQRTPIIPSRSSSQRRALNRFTRELEKYANATAAARKAPVITPTPSESRASYHTVKPLMPYRDEFAAAGLAVTSEEQRHQSPAKMYAHPNASKEQAVELDGHHEPSREKQGPSASPSSSSGSVVQFTPPDGYKTHLMEPLTPPPKSKLRPKPKPQEKRKLFPWLRRKPPVVNRDDLPLESYDGVRLVKDASIQIYPRVSSSLGPKAEGDTRVRSSKVQNMPPGANKQLPKSPRLPRDAISPKRLPCTALSLVECEQGSERPRSTLQTAQCRETTEERQLRLLRSLHGEKDSTRTQTHTVWPQGPIETIEEEKDVSSRHFDHPVIPARSSKASRKGKPAPANRPRQPPVASSEQTQTSSAPSLPFTAKYSVSTPSSLERALDAVSRKFDKLEQHEGNPCDHLTGLVEKTSKPRNPALRPLTEQKATRTNGSHRSRPTEKAAIADRAMSPEKVAQPDTKPLPPEPTREPPANVPIPTANTPLNEKGSSEQARTEQMLKDFDVFLDYDDGDINDRDVIKGLEVAVHAAADDLYDAYIRNKTGLRIRRFLADLKSVDEMQQESGSRRHREQRAESRRIQRIQDRKTLHRLG